MKGGTKNLNDVLNDLTQTILTNEGDVDAEPKYYLKDFICPISYEVMQDPMLASDGHTYDYESLKELFRISDNMPESPLTRIKLKRHVSENHTLRAAIKSFETLMDRLKDANKQMTAERDELKRAKEEMEAERDEFKSMIANQLPLSFRI